MARITIYFKPGWTGCTDAREFLAHRTPVERNIIRDRLDAKEIRALAKRAGGAINMVKPTARAEVEDMTDAQIVAWLEEDPKRLRRPIIDTGGALHFGFTKAVREALG